MDAARRAFIAGLGGLALAAPTRAAPGGRIALVGYNDMAEMLAALDAAFAARYPGVRFATDLRGTRFGPAALADGRATIAPMGAMFTPVQMAAYRAAAGAEPLGFRIAHASLDPKALSGPNAFFVHAGNPLRAAEAAMLARLFTTPGPHPWSALGLTGPRANASIRLAGLMPDTPLALELRSALFPTAAFATGIRGFRQSRDLVDFVAGEPAALGFAALNRASAGVRALGLITHPGGSPVFATPETMRRGAYPLDRFLWLYTRPGRTGKLDPLTRAYVGFALSDRGQAVIGQGRLGYIPLGEAERRRERARLAGAASIAMTAG